MLFTKTTIYWSLSLDNDQFELMVDGRKLGGSATLLENFGVTFGAFWAAVKVTSANGQVLALDGIPNSDARKLKEALTATIGVIRQREQVAGFIRDFGKLVQPVIDWVLTARNACDSQLSRRGWLSFEFKERVGGAKPQGLAKLLAVPEVEQHLAKQSQEVQDSVAMWKRPFQKVCDGINKRHLANELAASKAFFENVEKSPLTSEQTQAVVCFDSRVLLVASAGSGKTSTMVAKAGYALKKGYFAADRMLMLAFNNDAAVELRERIKARLGPLGLQADKVVAKTFHAFGLDVVGLSTGKRPSLAPWVESGQDLDALLAMADSLKDSDPAFRANWDLFRMVFGQDLPKFGKEQEAPEAWDSDARRGGFRTLNNEVVKSRGELVIANWFFYNGVSYVYECPYKHETADPTHRQYRPDFYLTDADAYLEHWALDENGEPPPEFTGYEEGIAWKRKLHAQYGTKLLETTMAELWSGKVFHYLAAELPKLGITLDPNPDREVLGRKPIENPRLAGTFRSFLTHAKSNRLTLAELRKRLETGSAGNFRYRHEMFLRLFEQLWKVWEDRLRSEKCIDFEDMLNLAADCIEQGRWTSPYELVMVDEFQDASQARARLVSCLVKGPEKYLFAVGDDWQSINRFAGADLAVMTDFEAKFGRAVTLKLETTFRCPQSLCDISGAFVQKNPKQLRKNVRSPKAGVSEPVRIVSVLEETSIRSAVEARIAEVASEGDAASQRPKVYVLGRYRNDETYMPRNYDPSRVEVEFVTVHSSKGLESDHVILPRMTSETLGFPSRVADDPVLQLAMPSGDSHEYAEERRLFYVALTRARSTVTLITVARKESPFISELVKDQKLEIRNADGSVTSSEVCPLCGTGFLVPRKGKYGPFFGCTAFPRCAHTRKIPTDSRHRSSGYASRSR